MAENEDLFKTTAFGGYDKDDVQQQIQKLKDDAYEEKMSIQRELNELKAQLEAKEKELADKDVKIADLQEALISRDKEILDMERNIREKYQSYVDNYDTIGSLIYEAKIRAKQIDRETEAEKQRVLSEAETEAQRIRSEAQAEAQKTLDDVQQKIDDRNREGEQKYDAVQEELSHVVEIFSQVQKQFMNSYRNIQRIVNDAPGQVAGLEDCIREEDDED